MSKGSIFSPAPTPRPKRVRHCWTARRTPAEPATLGRALLESIVDGYFRQNCFLCSPEYRNGLIDGMCQRAFGTALVMRFERGSAQYDAFMAGVEHGLGLSLPNAKGGQQ